MKIGESYLKYTPHGEMDFIFIIRHATVPDFEVVHIVPGPYAAFIHKSDHLVKDIHHRAMEAREGTVPGGTRTSIIGPVERVVYIPRHAPRIRKCLGPHPWIVFPPVAHRVENMTAFRELKWVYNSSFGKDLPVSFKAFDMV